MQQILARANEALAADKLFEPAGDNALELYLAAIAQAEAEAASASGGADSNKPTRRLTDAMADADLVSQTRLAITDILPYGLVWVERAITSGSRPEAARVLALLERAQPGASSLQRLREQLAEAENKAERDAAQAVAAAEAAEAAARAAAARPVATEAEAAQPTPAAPATTTPTPAPTQAQPVSTPAPAVATPTPAPAPSTPPPAQSLPSGATPRVISQPELRYPTQALRRQTEGFVVVSFTINPDGSTSNVEVVRALPRGLFEREAARIVAGLKFQPPGRSIQAERQIDFKLK